MSTINEKTKCATCGRPMVYYIKTLTPGIVYAAIKFKRAVRFYNRNSIHLKNDMKSHGTLAEFKLTDSEWTNFNVLREFGLIVHGNDKNPKSGYWLLTSRGRDFLNGAIALPYKIKSYQGHPVGPAAQRTVTIHDYKNKISWFESDFEFENHPKGEAQTSTLW